jgi:hypothetical protein
MLNQVVSKVLTRPALTRPARFRVKQSSERVTIWRRDDIMAESVPTPHITGMIGDDVVVVGKIVRCLGHSPGKFCHDLRPISLTQRFKVLEQLSRVAGHDSGSHLRSIAHVGPKAVGGSVPGRSSESVCR